MTRIRFSREIVALRMASVATTAAFFGLLGVLALGYSAARPEYSSS